MSDRQRISTDPADGMSGVVERNIRALLEHQKLEDSRRSLEERIAEKITRFTGSMRFVYIHLVVFGAWILINIGWIPLPQFDPSLVILAMAASVEAIFLSTFVLITQNRMAQMSDRRADLDLHISLLAEHEITRLIRLTVLMAEKMGIEEAKSPELPELSNDVAPDKVLTEIQKIHKQ